MWAIIMALNSAAVFRLRRTWDSLSAVTMKMFEKSNTIAQASRNYVVYRNLLNKVQLPCVPFCGLYTKDLTFIEDGNPDYLRSDPRLINFTKCQRIANVIIDIKRFQSVP